MNNPSVTIAVPTYNRAKLLQSTLDSIVSQDYSNITVLVSDNCTQGSAVDNVIMAFQSKIKNLKYYKQQKNIGSFDNFFFLLEKSETDYFMWLADDDEISDEFYISTLVRMHQSVANVATVVANWEMKTSSKNGVLMKTSSFPQESSLKRVLSFMWESDDAFFYGLHNTNLLKKCSFSGYWWPNKNELTNWAYVFLLDMVMQGKIVLCDNPDIRWISHSYVEKHYVISRNIFLKRVYTVFRRFNLQVFNAIKAIKYFGIPYFPIFIVLFIVLLFKDIFSSVKNGIKNRL